MAALAAAPSARAKARAKARMGRLPPALCSTGPASTAPVIAAPAAAPPFMIEFSQACVSVPLPLGAAAAAPPNKVASVGPRNKPASGAATASSGASRPAAVRRVHQACRCRGADEQPGRRPGRGARQQGQQGQGVARGAAGGDRDQPMPVRQPAPHRARHRLTQGVARHHQARDRHRGVLRRHQQHSDADHALRQPGAGVRDRDREAAQRRFAEQPPVGGDRNGVHAGSRPRWSVIPGTSSESSTGIRGRAGVSTLEFSQVRGDKPGTRPSFAVSPAATMKSGHDQLTGAA